MRISGIVVVPEDSEEASIIKKFRRRYESMNRKYTDNHITLRYFPQRLHENASERVFPNFQTITVEFIGLRKKTSYTPVGEKRYTMFLVPSQKSVDVLDKLGNVIDAIIPNGYMYEDGYHMTLMNTTDDMTDKEFEALTFDEIKFPFTLNFPVVSVLQPNFDSYVIDVVQRFFTGIFSI